MHVCLFRVIAVADSAFSPQSWLVPAFRDEARLSEEEQIFQKELPKVRANVEDA